MINEIFQLKTLIYDDDDYKNDYDDYYYDEMIRLLVMIMVQYYDYSMKTMMNKEYSYVEMKIMN